jgi:hypothetical protein
MSDGSGTIAGTAVQEYDAIIAAIQHYIEGGRKGSSAEMKKAFHADATIFGYLGPDFIGGPIQGLYDWVDRNPPAAGLQVRIVSVNVEHTVASVRLDMDNWGGHRFTDMFTMLKVDGEWKVINKVFHLHGE